MAGERKRPAFGAPGMAARWTSGAKTAVGTAYSTSSRVWFTLYRGCLTELYYPAIDTPQIRDLQFLITDGESFFHEERKSLRHSAEGLDSGSLGVKILSEDQEGRYKIHKQIIVDPYLSCLLMRSTIEIDRLLQKKLRLFVLCAPHLNIGGAHNNGEVIRVQDLDVLTAWKDTTHLALACTTPFAKCSVGYVGVSDGWQDLFLNFQMDWEFDHALDGNIALMGEIDLQRSHEFTTGLAFGETRQNALATLAQSLCTPFEHHRARFINQWDATKKRVQDFESDPGHDHELFSRSVNLLLAHEDKSYPGAMIAALSIPWGELKGDEELGGYHLVWVRDMCQAATALLAVGDRATALRSLIYLAVSQHADGSFSQNFWIDGRPYWSNVQLDEIAFPIMLAWRIRAVDGLRNFQPFTMVRDALSFMIREGPITHQERWEEAPGYSPSTLAASIAAILCGADFFRDANDEATAVFLEEYADYLESHVDDWTATRHGTLHPDIPRHYIRVNPVIMSSDGFSDEDPDVGTLHLANQLPGRPEEYPARDIVDAGFLELVRYGVRKPNDPLMVDSLRVVDRVLKVNTPFGPCWRRYNHDGYGQMDDGTGFVSYGVGRAWPLLTGERAHYELAAGHNAKALLKTFEAFATGVHLFPEQVWDQPESPMPWLKMGRQTGAAIPLVWAHAEYVKLVQSIAQGYPTDRLAPVYKRYVESRPTGRPIDVWKFSRRPRTILPGVRLRIIAGVDFQLRYSLDEWASSTDVEAETNGLKLFYAEIDVPEGQRSPIRFTFYWKLAESWEGKDYFVTPAPRG